MNSCRKKEGAATTIYQSQIIEERRAAAATAAAENGAQEKSRENRGGKITRTATSATAAPGGTTRHYAALTAAHIAQLIALSFHEKIRWLTGAETAAAALHSDPFGMILSKNYEAFLHSKLKKSDWINLSNL